MKKEAGIGPYFKKTIETMNDKNGALVPLWSFPFNRNCCDNF